MDFIDKLDKFAIRTYNWFMIKFVVIIFIIIVVLFGVMFLLKMEDIKEIIKIIEDIAYKSIEDDKK